MVSKLRAERVLQGLSMKAVCDKIGVRVSTLQSWEMGRTAPNITLACKLAAVYGKTVDELFLPDDFTLS